MFELNNVILAKANRFTNSAQAIITIIIVGANVPNPSPPNQVLANHIADPDFSIASPNELPAPNNK
ncbi:hypothetical protein, partial [Pelorhabdus rhamnosifermentans]|uniref:hypothetical protein n=1 Tax=Pelorhabdus rhamnosifermentans TaxID=2772457 RepID=UPI001C06455E